MTENMRQVEYGAAEPKAAQPPSNPPPYEHVAGEGSSKAPESSAPRPGPSYSYSPNAPNQSGGPAYYYQHPITGEVISTHLPPNHPEMVCLQAGEHVRSTRFGILGVLAAIFWFPLGIGLCLIDRRIVCKRCGRVLDGGISC